MTNDTLILGLRSLAQKWRAYSLARRRHTLRDPGPDPYLTSVLLTAASERLAREQK